jgi:CheY-like chemotaxis protein
MDKVKVLVVEDELLIAQSIKKALEGLGYEVMKPVTSFTRAVAAIEDGKPDVAILDIQLSGLKTGIDLGAYILETYDFPFIVPARWSKPCTLVQDFQLLHISAGFV